MSFLKRKVTEKSFLIEKTIYFLRKGNIISYYERKELLEENVARVMNFKSEHLSLNPAFGNK
jgi:hypothetical protein